MPEEGSRAATRDLGARVGHGNRTRAIRPRRRRRRTDTALGRSVYATRRYLRGGYLDVLMGASGGRAIGVAEHPSSNTDPAQGGEPALPGTDGPVPSQAHPWRKVCGAPVGADRHPPFVNAEPVLDEIEEFQPALVPRRHRTGSWPQ